MGLAFVPQPDFGNSYGEGPADLGGPFSADVEVHGECHAGDEEELEGGFPEVELATSARHANPADPIAVEAPTESQQPAASEQPAATGKSKGSKKKGAADSGREYDQATRWSQHEVRILIAAKIKSDMVSSSGPRAKTRSRNEKWKEVEDYCFAEGVRRSGLACLNKWDSLLSEVKKVKSYETRRPSGKPGYFQMNQTEKREVALPANVDQQVYNLVLDATAGKASMTPPTVLESSSEGERGEKREDDEDPAPKDEAWMFGAARPEGSPFGEENERGLKRKGKWGEQRKELAIP